MLLASLVVGGCSRSDGPDIGLGRVARADVVEFVNAPGSVVPRAQATVTAPADATVAEVLVEPGQSVVAGVPLLRLDSPSAQAQLFQARTARDAADALPADQRLPTLAAFAAAQRAVDALVVKAPIAGTVQLGGADSGAPPASLDGLVGQLPPGLQGQAASALGGGAPAGATTSVAAIEPGVPVQRGTVLAVVFDLTGLSVIAEVDETDIYLVRTGVAADVEFDAVPGATYPGVVRAIELAPTTSSRGGVTYRVRLTLGDGTAADGTKPPLPRPGMSAVVDLRVREARDAVAVPTAAVIRHGVAGYAVWVVRDGRARRTPVTLGAQGDDVVQVVRGVVEGDRIVERGADLVRDGQEL